MKIWQEGPIHRRNTSNTFSPGAAIELSYLPERTLKTSPDMKLSLVGAKML